MDDLISHPETIFKIKITGKRLEQFFEEAYDILPDSKGSFLVFSRNIQIKLDCTKEPRKRIESFLING